MTKALNSLFDLNQLSPIQSQEAVEELKSTASAPEAETETPHPYEKEIQTAAEQHQIRPSLLSGTIDYFAKRKDSSQNLMQLTRNTAKHVGVKDRSDPGKNIQGGAKYLKEMLQRFQGDEAKALAAYYAGPSKVKRYGGVPPQKSVQGFVTEVLGTDSPTSHTPNSPESNSSPNTAKEATDSLKQLEQTKKGPADLDALVNDDLGYISKKYETSNRGVGVISNGKLFGEVSYGQYQICSNTGTMAAFLRSAAGKKYGEMFGKLKPGTRAFNQKYREIAAQEPQAFDRAQKQYVVNTLYNPAIKEASKLGFDVKNRGVQEMVFSASMQHGGVKKILRRTAWNNDLAKISTEAEIKAFYKERGRYVARVVNPRLSQMLQRRYRSEVNDTLAAARMGQRVSL